MQEVFEKIKERLEEKKDLVPVNRLLDDIINDKPLELGQLMAYAEAIEIVNQVAGEYVHNKEKEMYEAGYTKALDDAIEKFLEYGCFMIQWTQRLSKEDLVTDVMRQVKGQAVYTLEKMKQKEIDSVNQVAEECSSKSSSLENDGWISLPKVAFNRMIARMESESEKDWNDEEWFINVVDAARIMREIVKEYSDSENPNKSDDGWIPVSSGKMPENGRRCWVTYEWANGSLHVDKDYLVNGKWFETEYEAVKAWMYNDEKKPEPYKPKGEK